jgi:hypothetical protein
VEDAAARANAIARTDVERRPFPLRENAASSLTGKYSENIGPASVPVIRSVRQAPS